MQRSKDIFDIFKVYFDSLAELEQSPLVNNEKCLVKQALPGGIYPVQLPSGKIHIGWPNRVDTGEQMIDDFKKFCDRSSYDNQTEPNMMTERKNSE